jgi:uncharacterized protein (TIGR02145 family)
MTTDENNQNMGPTMFKILSEKKFILYGVLVLFLASCSNPTAPDDEVPSYDLNTGPVIHHPPDHFKVYAYFSIQHEAFGCDIEFPDDSVWKLSVETSPKKGVEVAAAIITGNAYIRDYTILIDNNNPDPTCAGFKSCFIYHFSFSDNEYDKNRTVTYEFEKTAMNYGNATVAVGDTVDCDSVHIVMDIDRNVYQTVNIGAQVWMAENLQVTHYRNGDAILNIKNFDQWSDLTWDAYCDYGNDEYHTTPGHLYNWYTVNDFRNIAPEGWHVPSDEEWKQLEMCLGMIQPEADDIGWRGIDEGSKMKSSMSYWASDATNASGFSALTGGYRHSNGDFLDYYLSAYFWSSTIQNSDDAWYRYLNHDESRVNRDAADRRFGFSVRCVRD